MSSLAAMTSILTNVNKSPTQMSLKCKIKGLHGFNVNTGNIKSILTLWTLLTVMMMTSVVISQDYCNMPNCGALHVACDYWQQRQDPSCPRKTYNVRINSTLIRHILYFHNRLRNLVAGGRLKRLERASRMATMVWDITLSQLAQIKAMHCNVYPDQCHPTKEFRYSGQLLAMALIPNGEPIHKTVGRKLRWWAKGASRTTPADIEKLPANVSTEIAAFALLINERNTHVGCGICKYRLRGVNRAVFVCDYATQNFIGLPTYHVSKKAGSGCRRKNIVFTNLCSPSEKYNYEPKGALKSGK